jgi:hypothetical protein
MMATAVPLIFSWGDSVLPAIVFVLLLLGPGALVLLSLGAGYLRAIVFAPIVSVALAGLGGVLLHVLGIRWDLVAFCAMSLVVVIGVLLIRTVVLRAAAWRIFRPQTRPGWRDPMVAAVVLGLVISAVVVVVQYLGPVGGAQNITFNYDTVWHDDVIRHILLTGDASSLDVGLLDGTAGSHYYPAAWHSLIALTVDATGASLPAAVNASVFVLFAFVWPLNAAVLAVRLFGPSRLVVLGTLVAAPLFAAFPAHFLDYGPLYSNLLSFAILPACVALGVEWLNQLGARRRPPRLAAGVALIAATFVGMIFAQPNSLFTLFVILLPLADVALFRSVRGRWPARRWTPWTLSAVFTIAWVAGWIAVHDSAPLRRTVSVDWPASLSEAQAFGEFVLQGTVGEFPQVLLVVLVGIGLVVAARRRRIRWLVASYAALGVLYVLDAGNSGGPHSLRDYATGFWYHDSVRLAAATVLLAAPLAGRGFRWVVTLIVTKVPTFQAGRRSALVAVAAAVALVGLSLVADHALLVRRTFLHDSAAIDEFQMLNPAKVAFLREVAATVPEGVRIANDPNDGSGYAYSMFSLPVVFAALPGNWLGSPTTDQVRVLSSLNTIGSDPSICTVVAREKIGYVLALSAPRTADTPRTVIGYSAEMWQGVRVDGSTPGFHKILEKGAMSLYKITAC